jgi:hypothetical protein
MASTVRTTSRLTGLPSTYLAWLLHGPELSRLTVYFAPLFEVQAICGGNALGCYGASIQAMVVPGDRSLPMEQIIAHEYGHHIEANRDNAPWSASDWGPKYWASSVGVCQRVQSGTAFPGDEGAHYTLNPGEAFADSYRLLNVSRAAASWWGPIMPFSQIRASFQAPLHSLLSLGMCRVRGLVQR